MSEELNSDSRSWGPVIAKWAFLLLTLVLLGALVFTLKSVLHAIILGVLFAMLLMPVHTFILGHVERLLLRRTKVSSSSKRDQERRLHQIDSRNRSIASALTVSFVFFVIVIPLSMFTFSVGKQGFKATLSAQEWLVKEFPGKVHELVVKYSLDERLEELYALYERFEANGEEDAEGIKDLSEGVTPCAQSDMEVGCASSESRAQGVGEGSPDGQVSGQEHSQASEQASSVVLTEQADGAEGDGKASVSEGTGTEEELLPVAPKAKEIGPLVGRMVGNVLQVVRDSLLAILSQIWILIFNFCIMLFVMYQIFYDGKNIFAYMKSISPLGDEEQRRVSMRLKEVSRAIFFGIFGTAVTQGIFAMIAFKLVGIPVFWGVVLGMCSIVPVVGTSIIWVPVTVYLAMIGEYGKALAAFVMCGCLIANLDMLLRPLLMKKSGDTGLSYMVLFLSILGGIQSFGLVGVIYGPLIAGLCSICLLLFSTQFKGVQPSAPPVSAPEGDVGDEQAARDGTAARGLEAGSGDMK